MALFLPDSGFIGVNGVNAGLDAKVLIDFISNELVKEYT
jgi:hypothetical protein